jgi:hypothetical protein
MAAQPAGRRAVPVLGGLGLIMVAAWVLLTCLTRDLQLSRVSPRD